MMMRFDPVGLAPHAPGAGALAGTDPAALQWRAALQRAARGPDGDVLPEAAAPARPRVAWRDAGAASTWLAPVRERAPAEDERPAALGPDGAFAAGTMEPAASDTKPDTAAGDARRLQDPRERRLAAANRAADVAGATAAQAQLPQQAMNDAADQGGAPIGRGWAELEATASVGSAGVPPAAARAAPPGAAPAGPAGAALPGTAAAALPAPDGDANAPPDAAAPQAQGPSAARRPAGQPFQATHLHIGPGDAGLTWWLRDASAGDAGAARLLQALVALAVPRELRPAAMFLNGHPIKEMPGRSQVSLAPPGGPAHGAIDPSRPNIKEDPHGH